MANRSFKKDAATLEAGIIKLYGKFTTTTSGTIGSSTLCKGFSVVKTAAETGRYTVTLADKYNRFLMCNVVIQGAADAAYTSAKGLTWFIRAVDVAATAASTKLFYLQFCDPDGSPADAELEDGAIVFLEITVKNSSVY